MTITAFILLLQSFWASNGVYIMAILFSVSEILAVIPAIKQNSLVEFLLKFIMLLAKKK